MEVLISFLRLLVIDLVFVLALLGILRVASMALPGRGRAMRAVFRRNFVGYFINPTGYVFLMLFVLASSAVGFWPDAFFNSNLATLGQLNQYFPLLLLFFIPSITMSIWADERRQGTDELLLTIPASDLDIVLGKYLAAGGFFSASLLFSQLANFWVLNLLSLGDIDVGLFFGTYLGYWLAGLAMLALGMVASFFTNSLTVGFILGVLFNAPLVMAEFAKLIPFDRLAKAIAHWSYAEQFADFGRGVVSLRALTFFGMLIVMGLYLSMALIGRRHWWGGKDGESLLGHFVVRAVSLAVIAGAVNLVFAHRDFRHDITSAKISSLSPDTRELIRNVNSKHPILVEAFIGKNIPNNYVRTRLDLITMLHEFRSQSAGQLDVRIHDGLDMSSEEAQRAEQQYGIRPETVTDMSEGALKQVDLLLGVAFTSGLQRVVVPFFDHGLPVEYELVRSIATVAQEKRKRIGVVQTDAQLFGGFDMQRFTPRPKQLIIEELEKQYDVVQVDPSSPIEEEFDVLMAVQPSSLTQPQLGHLINAIRRGQATAIFEDPFPVALDTAPGTGQPKRPQGGMMGFNSPPEQKGDIQQLFDMLGVEMVGEPGFGMFDANVIWQRFNPYPQVQGLMTITDEWVFVAPEAPGSQDPLSGESSITSGLNQLLLLYPGAVQKEDASGLQFTPLVTTGNQTGRISVSDLMGQSFQRVEAASWRPTSDRYVLAARIRGKVKQDPSTRFTAAQADGEDSAADGIHSADQPSGKGDAAEPDEEVPSGENDIDVVFVTDVDLMHSDFLRLRARPQGDINWNFDNVTFVLNILDVLAGDDRFVDIRKRQMRHSSLKLVEDQLNDANQRALEEMNKFRSEFQKAVEKTEAARDKQLAELRAKVDELRKEAQESRRGRTRELETTLLRMQVQEQITQQRLESETERARRRRDRNLREIELEMERTKNRVRSTYRLLSAFVPPLPPIAVALMVFSYRRRRESELIAEERRR